MSYSTPKGLLSTTPSDQNSNHMDSCLERSPCCGTSDASAAVLHAELPQRLRDELVARDSREDLDRETCLAVPSLQVAGLLPAQIIEYMEACLIECVQYVLSSQVDLFQSLQLFQYKTPYPGIDTTIRCCACVRLSRMLGTSAASCARIPQASQASWTAPRQSTYLTLHIARRQSTRCLICS